ncbi:Neuropeptide Y receptor type [Trichinella spiralis]|uniref:Neuropeptide Y receptor type n=1 Tax=Trichinella spiralis TaxID=6334 RepID=A0ABR3KZW7_TRISP
MKFLNMCKSMNMMIVVGVDDVQTKAREEERTNKNLFSEFKSNSPSVTTSADECDSMALRDWSGRGERHLRKRYSRSFTMSPPAGAKPSTRAVVLDGSDVGGVALAGKRDSLTSVNKKPDLPVWARMPA